MRIVINMFFFPVSSTKTREEEHPIEDDHSIHDNYGVVYGDLPVCVFKGVSGRERYDSNSSDESSTPKCERRYENRDTRSQATI